MNDRYITRFKMKNDGERYTLYCEVPRPSRTKRFGIKYHRFIRDGKELEDINNIYAKNFSQECLYDLAFNNWRQIK